MKVSPRHGLPGSSSRRCNTNIGMWYALVVGTSFLAGYWWCAATSDTALPRGGVWENGPWLGAATQLDESRTSLQPPLSASSSTTTTPTKTPVHAQQKEGWATIDVFYGTRDHLRLPSNRTWYSQGRQDELVAGLLRHKRRGYFIDLAANDAVKWSNTLALERQLGWNGLCIEPNAAYWKDLSYRQCQVVGAVVGRMRDEQVMFGFEHPQGGEFGGISGNRPKEMGYSTRQSTVTLLEIFQRYNVPREIDYLSLDVEGAEAMILTAFPLQDYRIKVITVERLNEQGRQFLKNHSYYNAHRVARWGEVLWLHESVRDQVDMTTPALLGLPLKYPIEYDISA